MSATIFCTFEQQDLADLAVGKLRATTKGIKSIHYITGSREQLHPNVQNSFIGEIFTNIYAAPAPSRPVTVKIVCNSTAAHEVTAKLINMHAYGITRA